MFSLFLGTHSRLVGLGGIDRSVGLLAEGLANSDLKKLQKLRCTCGAAATECRYWGEVARAIPSHDVSNRRAQYKLALEVFPKVFGEDAWPVDSSKHVEPLDDLCQIEGLNLKVTHLIKDVRSLTASFIDQARRKQGKTRPGALLALGYFWRWQRENRKIDVCLKRNALEAKRVGYEEVCMAPEVIMGAVSAFLGIPVEPGSLDFKGSNSHLIVGNRMREQEEKQKLSYDHRWFARRDWIPAAVLLPQVLSYNEQAVYSNGSDVRWTR